MARSYYGLVIAYALGVGLMCVSAQTSLYIPSFEDQPLSISELGAGSDGRTTWEVIQGSITPGASTDESFPGTATLVEGPNDAVIIYNVEGLSASESCAISNGLASCTVIAALSDTLDSIYTTSSEAFTETVSPFVVQGGASTPSPTPSPGSSAPSSNPTSAPSQSRSGGALPSSTSNGDLRLKMASSSWFGVLVTGLLTSLL